MSNEAFEELVIELEGRCADMSRQQRMDAVEALTDRYVMASGNKPPCRLLERLTDIVLHEELTDKRNNKMQIEEYPIMSEWQYARRVLGTGARNNKAGVRNKEVPLEAASNVGTNGVDYTPSKRSFANPF